MNLSDEDIFRLAAQAKEGYDFSQLVPRGRRCDAGEKIKHSDWGDEDWRCAKPAQCILGLADLETVALLCREHFDFVDKTLDEQEEGK